MKDEAEARRSVAVYTYFAVTVKFYVVTRRNPYCDEKYLDLANKRLSCHYEDSVTTLRLTYTLHCIAMV